MALSSCEAELYALCEATKENKWLTQLLAEMKDDCQAKSQKTVALSSCEAELYALCEAAKEILWLSQLLQELNVEFTVDVEDRKEVVCSTMILNFCAKISSFL